MWRFLVSPGEVDGGGPGPEQRRRVVAPARDCAITVARAVIRHFPQATEKAELEFNGLQGKTRGQGRDWGGVLPRTDIEPSPDRARNCASRWAHLTENGPPWLKIKREGGVLSAEAPIIHHMGTRGLCPGERRCEPGQPLVVRASSAGDAGCLRSVCRGHLGARVSQVA